MTKLFNGLAGQAARQANAQAQPRWGIIQSYDPKTHQATVMIQPENRLSGWLPISTASVGNGIGVWTAPTAGQQAFLLPDQGDSGSFVIVGFAFSDQNRVPGVPKTIRGQPTDLKSGETAITGPKDVLIRVNDDGTIFMKAKTVNIEGDLEVTGDIHTEKNVKADENVEAKKNVEADVDMKAGGQVEDFHNTLDALRQDYNQHQHPAGFGGKTGTTTKPD